MEYLREVLSELGLEPERIQFETVGPGMLAQLLKTCQAVEERIRKLGISPVRRAKGIQRIYDQFTFPVDSKTFVIYKLEIRNKVQITNSQMINISPPP